jgi:diaminohydroxyphosphoribosylaminopyrimidine deaminase/5-amino-6-(5-phosphoribosylamino)uracil reductase
MVEGGSNLLGHFFDRQLVDKVLAFIAPIIVGGEEAKTAVGGSGVAKVSEALRLKDVKFERFEDGILISGYT